jgi:hypothetical protein
MAPDRGLSDGHGQQPGHLQLLRESKYFPASSLWLNFPRAGELLKLKELTNCP